MPRFTYNHNNSMTWPNGAKGYRPYGEWDCLGPYAKVVNCPIDKSPIRVTAYATGYPDSYFSLPAMCKIRGRYIGGHFSCSDDGPVFVPYTRFRDRIPAYLQLTINQQP